MKTPKKRQGRSPVWFPFDVKAHLDKAEHHLKMVIESHTESAKDSKSDGDIWTPQEEIEYRDTIRRFKAALKTIQTLNQASEEKYLASEEEYLKQIGDYREQL